MINLPKAQIPLKGFSDYFFENIAVGYVNQLQITSKCNAKCMYCSNEQNHFEVKRCSFRPVDEIEKIVWSLPDTNYSLYLNESLPGRISEGEAFIHPNFFEILEIIRKKFPYVYIKSTTNGSLLTPEFIDKLEKFKPMEISISTTSINKEYWKETFNLSDKHYDIAINAADRLRQKDIPVVINLVPMPSWVGWDDLEKTISRFAPLPFYVYGPGYTKYTTREKNLKKFEYDKMELSLFLEKMSDKYRFIYSWPLNPRILLDIDRKNIANHIQDSCSSGDLNILWLTSVAAKERFVKEIEALGIGIPITNIVTEVKNNTYGGNIEVAGLWVLKDIEDTLDEYLKNNKKPDKVFIPKIFLDKYGFDLSGDNVTDLIKKYNYLKFEFI